MTHVAATDAAHGQDIRMDPASTRREIVIAVVADANGWIATPRDGAMDGARGLAHLAGPLRDLRRRHGGLPVLAIGDWVSGAPAPYDPAPTLLRIAAELNVAAALPGERDLLRMLKQGQAWSGETGMAWLASDLAGLPGLRSYLMLQHGGVRIGLIGLVRPGLVTATLLRRAGIAVHPAADSARKALSSLSRSFALDAAIGLVNAARDGAEEQATALAWGIPIRDGVHDLADGSLPVDMLIVPDRAGQGRGVEAVSVDTVPLVRVAPGLTAVHIALEKKNGRWRIVTVRQEALFPSETPDPAILASAGELWERSKAWLAEPTRAIVSSYTRKQAFIACAGELSHGAAAFAANAVSKDAGERFISLMPQLWRYEPLRKRDAGSSITRGRLYRWMPHDDLILPARLTGRQIALMLEPWARFRSGWTFPHSLVLYPGGIEPELIGRATQPERVRLAPSGPVLGKDALYPAWLTVHHAFGAGGLARRALIQAGQLGAPLEIPLREWVYRWMASPVFALPEPCRPFLALRPDGSNAGPRGSPAAPGRG
jgi:2',3'-cyclic-nucleotide 2'-phosphodiesterase (5'-nucleotidase family)